MLTWLRWIAHVVLLASIIPVMMAIYQMDRARRAPFYVARAAALQRVRRWALVALLMVVVALILLIVAPRLARLLGRPTEPARGTPTAISAVMVTSTSRPTRTPTVTPTRRPTATPPFIPTSTPDVQPPESAATPLPGAVPAGEDARIKVITLAADRDEAGQPVDPGTEFPPGDHRIYLFISYDGMANGISWTFAIYRGGELVDSATQVWEWGAAGKTYLYFKPPGGYEPGLYEMQVFVEERLQGVAQFVITE
jgi:hypothetical protein